MGPHFGWTIRARRSMSSFREPSHHLMINLAALQAPTQTPRGQRKGRKGRDAQADHTSSLSDLPATSPLSQPACPPSTSGKYLRCRVLKTLFPCIYNCDHLSQLRDCGGQWDWGSELAAQIPQNSTWRKPPQPVTSQSISSPSN